MILHYSHFLPDTGNLFSVRTPQPSKDIRVETGFIQGDQISVHYDPMISKLVVRGEDRNDALRRFRRALEQYQVNNPILFSLSASVFFGRGMRMHSRS